MSRKSLERSAQYYQYQHRRQNGCDHGNRVLSASDIDADELKMIMVSISNGFIEDKRGQRAYKMLSKFCWRHEIASIHARWLPQAHARRAGWHLGARHSLKVRAKES